MSEKTGRLRFSIEIRWRIFLLNSPAASSLFVKKVFLYLRRMIPIDLARTLLREISWTVLSGIVSGIVLSYTYVTQIVLIRNVKCYGKIYFFTLSGWCVAIKL